MKNTFWVNGNTIVAFLSVINRGCFVQSSWEVLFES